MLYSLAIQCSFAADHTFYVSTGGSDTNDGSQGAPFATINHAVTSVTDNSSAVIYLGAGETFTEYGIRIEDNTNKTVELIGDNTVFQAAAVKQTASTGRMLFSGYGSNLKVSGIIFKNGYQAAAGSAVYFRGVTMEVVSCRFYDNIATSHGGAIASLGIICLLKIPILKAISRKQVMLEQCFTRGRLLPGII